LNCKKIVENLMTYTRRPARHDDFTDINHDLETVVNLARNTLLTKMIEVEMNLAGGLPRVRGDASEMQQVFLNLINNAVAAMPGGGKLTVISRLNPYTHQVEAVIADTGVGIPREIADRVFDPFFTTKKVGEGTGLGLSVSHAIVNKFGGSIRFETRTADSKTPGPTGTTFFISFQPENEESGGVAKSQAAN
jgi:two-component system NtrC family sensor kinase